MDDGNARRPGSGCAGQAQVPGSPGATDHCCLPAMGGFSDLTRDVAKQGREKAGGGRCVANRGQLPGISGFCYALIKYLQVWRHIHPTVNGFDLHKRGLPPGPAYKYILGSLKDAWLDGKITNIEEESKLFEHLLADCPSDNFH